MVNLKMLVFDLALAGYVLIAISVFLPPVLLNVAPHNQLVVDLSNFILDFYHPLCHQMPVRSLFFGDIKFPVCSRCTSIYLATALGLIYFRLKGFGIKEFNMNWLLFLFLIAPTGIDGTTQMLGWRTSNNALRLITGFPYGLAWAYLIAWGLPLIWAVLALLFAAVRLKREGVNDALKRIKATLWPLI